MYAENASVYMHCTTYSVLEDFFNFNFYIFINEQDDMYNTVFRGM